jgi:hypothetical protein
MAAVGRSFISTARSQWLRAVVAVVVAAVREPAPATTSAPSPRVRLAVLAAQAVLVAARQA